MISSLAHIHPAAQIGKNVTIDPFAVVNEGVVIGEGTHIMSHVVVMRNTIIGNWWQSQRKIHRLTALGFRIGTKRIGANQHLI